MDNGDRDRPPNPIFISISENALMKSWDVELIVGNFTSESEAHRAADDIGKVLEDIYGATLFKTKIDNETLQ